MLRALSTRNGRGYEKLRDEYHESSTDPFLDPKLMRARTVPAGKLFSTSSTKHLESGPTREEKKFEKKAKKVSKVHPIFTLFHPRLRQKATAKPEVSRYLEYLKEGGILPTNGNMPVV
ncbi:OLC1v1010904C1 [Oldenlandia corymbosa var. corymbosa]|uniref:OLC1v1010904C1 n=1 Tax=Oldenlandia corymbosa var. corymbosa TaxID=529605 RepID=A0AAV1DV68_OLDCO|nr:OLC1v1010904C1 [Oldenlandia corymbosa var. corymbosa]